MAVRFPFDNTYARLPQAFYATLGPTPVAAPRLVKLNTALAEHLGLDPDALASPEGVAILAGNAIPSGANPLAQAYAGHQFGGFTPQLGDGRALLLGEIVAPDGARFDIQLKGSGPTPFSRRGDGRAALGPVLREYIISEAMAALGIPTTRSLAAVVSGDLVQRETAQPGGVLTRIAASHIRVGTFQYFAARGDNQAVRLLADHAMARHYPNLPAGDYRGFLDAVIGRQAELIAQWMLVGFIHGVMNTDNAAVSGESIDFGPCAFMDSYDPATVFSSIDHYGRYAYGNQPAIAQWNMARLAETLLPLLDDDSSRAMASAEAALSGFAERFEAPYIAGLRQKIGLTAHQDGDAELVHDLLKAMKDNQADFTLTFRALCDAADGPRGDAADKPRGDAADKPRGDAAVRALFADPAAYDTWAPRWCAREPEGEIMRRVNPAVIPRNHQVEAALAAAVERDDFGPFETLVAVLARPFDPVAPGHERYTLPPSPEERVLQTFCGT